MVTLGYFLSSEEHDSHKLVEAAVLAERAGFRTATISDHFIPGCPSRARAPSSGACSARSQRRGAHVSNLSAHLPREAMRSMTSPRAVSTDELGRCDAEHGAGEQRVGAALDSASRQRPQVRNLSRRPAQGASEDPRSAHL